jgi:hypothetical protein
MALRLPLVARRLTEAFETADGQRWLFRAALDANRPKPAVGALWNASVPAMPLLLLDKARADASGCAVLFTTPEAKAATAEAMTAAGLAVDSTKLFEDLAKMIDGPRVRDLPRLFDRLKYSFRRSGVKALHDIQRELAWLQNDPESSLALVEALEESLGERCTQEILHPEILKLYPRARKQLPSNLRKSLEAAFRFAGVLLSDRVSVIAERQRWLILDHESDRVYEARRRRDGGEDFVDIYTEANCSYRDALPGRDLLLPVRVFDASHGVAVWSVDRQLVQEHLNLYPHNALRAWDIGGGKTPLALFMTAHREGDLGPYLELGLACAVTPRKDPLAVGMFVIGDILATEGLGRDASNRIWGARKDKAMLAFQRRDQSATMTLTNDQQEELLRVSLPRGGDATSVDVPLFLYTLKGETLHRTLLRRSGSGERLRAGGSGVSIEIEPAAGAANPLCDALRYFGIASAGTGAPLLAPLFTAWSEHVSAELPAPWPVVIRDEGEE